MYMFGAGGSIEIYFTPPWCILIFLSNTKTNASYSIAKPNYRPEFIMLGAPRPGYKII